ncbi:MAG: SUMF1/EgtB/PvdO family nonheme iron enzyme [bacterium]|nr:SUMF1/EgtB/PvdO family nonheme iron enzyme [bacterium]
MIAERGSNRVIRGGSWINNARNCRAANRNRNAPGNRNDNVGLRLVSTKRFARRTSVYGPGPRAQALSRRSSCAGLRPAEESAAVRFGRFGAFRSRRVGWPPFFLQNSWRNLSRGNRVKGKSSRAGSRRGRRGDRE